MAVLNLDACCLLLLYDIHLYASPRFLLLSHIHVFAIHAFFFLGCAKARRFSEKIENFLSPKFASPPRARRIWDPKIASLPEFASQICPCKYGLKPGLHGQLWEKILGGGKTKNPKIGQKSGSSIYTQERFWVAIFIAIDLNVSNFDIGDFQTNKKD